MSRPISPLSWLVLAGEGALIIRPGRFEDAPRLQEIERAAAQVFTSVGLPQVARADPTPLLLLETAAGDGLLLVAALSWPVGFALLQPLDAGLYLYELDVAPSHQHRGIGNALLAAVLERAAGLPHVTLTTYRDVPWNAPWYVRHGFVEIPVPEFGPDLAAIWRAEGLGGHDMRRRVALRTVPLPFPGEGGDPRAARGG